MSDVRGERELTLRAVAMGCLLGALLAAANVYSGLKTAVVDGGNVTAAVLAFALFAALRVRPGFGVLENNVVQTIAASAAMMAMVTGVVGPVPALALAGYTVGPGALVVWGMGLALLGILVALLLRGLLIEREALPFPTGAATAEVIEALASDHAEAARRARALLLAGLLAAAVTLLRDGPWALLPATLLLPGMVRGVSLATLSIGLSVSPLLLGTGVLIGVKASLCMLLGSLLAWLGLAPQLLAAGIMPDARYEQLVTWFIWPGAGLMLASSLTSLAFSHRALLRGLYDLRDLPGFNRGKRARPWLLAALLSGGLVLVLSRCVFELPLGGALLALCLSSLLAVASARSAGETDVAPVGAMGGVVQLALAGAGRTGSLAAGAMAAGQASQTAATLWALKSGARLGASVSSQALAQLVGALVGALVAVPTYGVVVRAYGLGTERMPAPGALSWKATADAVQGGVSALPEHAASAALIAALLAVLLTTLERTRAGRFVPSPVALGIGLILPVSLSAAVAIGALVWSLVARGAQARREPYGAAIAGGAIAGESLLAVLLAALLASGVLTS